MTDLEKTIDSTENTEGTTASGVGDDFSLDFSDSLPQGAPQINPDLSEVSSPSEDISSSNLNEDISSPTLTEDAPSPNLSEETSPSNTTENISSVVNEDTSSNLSEDIPSPDLSEDVPSSNLNEDVPSPDLTSDAPSVSVNLADNETTTPNTSTENTQPDLTNYQQETINNETSLWEIKNEWINTANTDEVNNTLTNPVDTPLEQPSLLEQPQINENPLAENPTNTNPQEQIKDKLTPKEKLAQLVKAHESKAQKSWFIKWIFSGIALTTVIVVAWFIFAKDQVLDLINKIDGNNQQLTANVVDITNTTDEEIIPEDKDINIDMDENINDEEIDIENEEINLENEFSNEELDEDIYDDKIIIDEDVDDTKDYLEDYLFIEEEDNDEDIQIEDSEELSYTITHVNSEEEANWVLPSHCSDLTCYGENKEFTPCTDFRQSENLDENANRIGKNWVCKYKDSSELVYVEFN